eukprot:gene18620-20497_t
MSGTIQNFECVQADSEKGCYEKIQKKEADAGVFDGGSIHDAGKAYDLRVVMAEHLNGSAQADTAYYAIAVAKATTSFVLNTLKGKKSCHTGVQKTSGWIVPVGTLIRKKLMQWKDCDQYATVAGFFSASCAPGASNTKYNKKSVATNQLCKLCNGTGSDNCKRSTVEPYYGYSGAFKCLEDGKGDVAFIKAAIMNALSTAEQAKYKLLCQDNTRKDPKDFATCNLARVPSHGVLARNDADISKVQAALLAANTQFKTYSPFGNGLFSKKTLELVNVASVKQPYMKYLDEAYMKDIKTLESCSSGALAVSGTWSMLLAALALVNVLWYAAF